MKGTLAHDEQGRVVLTIDAREIEPGDVLHYEIGADGPRLWVGPPIPVQRMQPDLAVRIGR